MARTDTLPHFLTDVADAIRTAEGSSEAITASKFDERIEALSGGGDLSEYLEDTLVGGNNYNVGVLIKKLPSNLTVGSTNLEGVFRGYKGTYVPELNTSNVTNFAYMFYQDTNITTIPQYNTSSGTNFGYMFYECPSLVSIPSLDLSKASSVSNMFNGCSQLTTVPVLNISSIRYNYQISSMFSNCSSLSTQSLDNILQMCVGASSFTGTKTLAQLGLSSSYYSASTIQALQHYQDFVNAGWTIGWS